MTGTRKFEIWLGFAGVGAVATLVLGAVGQGVAGRFPLSDGGASVWAGCLASLAGSLAGAVPLTLVVAGQETAKGAPGNPIPAIGKASLLRLLVALVAGFSASLSGRWDRRTLLLALAASYGVLLAVEIWWLLGRLRAAQTEFRG